MLNTVYMPMKPIRVNQTLPEETCGEMPACGAHEPVNQPRLAAEFRGHPTRRVGNVRKRQREHQRPEHAARIIEASRVHSFHAASTMMAMKMVPSPTMMW